MCAQRNSRGVDNRGASGFEAEVSAAVDASAKRHSPWSQVEHLLFLLGLEDHGRGAWRAISTNYCISRTPTQVASHAQKYFLRQELTPLQRHKKRPSIHDITCASIHPQATAADRDAVRSILQGIVREGRDIVTTGDGNTESSASSSSKSHTSNCLPIQDPKFAQVFAFTRDAAAANSGSSNEVITFRPASPRPLQYPYPTMQPVPGPAGVAAVHAPGNMWAVPPGSMIGPASTHQGMHMQPVMYAPGPGQQPQFAYFAPRQSLGMHMWPQQPMMLAAPMQPARPLHPLASHTSPRNHAPPMPQAPTLPLRQPAAGLPGGRIGPAGMQVGAIPHAALQRPLPCPPPEPRPARQELVGAPAPREPRPAPAAAVADAGGGPERPSQARAPSGVDRGTKREGAGVVEQAQHPGQYLAHSLPSLRVPEGPVIPWRAASPGMPYVPQQHGIRYWPMLAGTPTRPQMWSEPAKLTSHPPVHRVSVTMPENVLRASAVDSPTGTQGMLSVSLTAPSNVLTHRVASAYAFGSASSSAEGAGSFRRVYSTTSIPRSGSLGSIPYGSGSGSIPSSKSMWNPEAPDASTMPKPATVHPLAHSHTHSPRDLTEIIADPAPTPAAVDSPGGAPGAQLGDLSDPPHDQTQHLPPSPHSAEPPGGRPPPPSKQKDVTADGRLLGDALEFATGLPPDAAEDIVGYLFGSAAELGEAAFLDSYSFDRLGSSAGPSGSGRASGGSNGAGSSRGLGLPRRSSPP